jgi:Gamma-glutamyl cyclotransferase, AIG2-like
MMQKWIARLSLLFLLFILFQPAFASDDCLCHPSINLNRPQFIIAYGSLMEGNSKKATDNRSGENKPAWVEGYQRGWFSKGLSDGLSTTYLGVIKSKHAHFNGTLFSLPSSANAFKNYDAREKYYCRALVSPRAIHLLTGKKLPQGQFWIYELKPEFLSPPSTHYPIVQSYVDIFLAGCLEIEEKYHLRNFTAACVNTTSDWSPYWVNDRIYPRRPTVYQPRALIIDALLQQQIPTFFQQIKF